MICVFVTMGFTHRWCIAPLRGFLIRGIVYRWALPIADIFRRFAAVDYGVVYRWATPIAFVFRRFAALDLGYPVYDGLHPSLIYCAASRLWITVLCTDGLRPSLLYDTASRLFDSGYCIPMGFTHRWCIVPLRGFLIRGIVYRWASPIADVFRRFAAFGLWMFCTDGLRPSLIYFAASRLWIWGILFTMGLDN